MLYGHDGDTRTSPSSMAGLLAAQMGRCSMYVCTATAESVAPAQKKINEEKFSRRESDGDAFGYMHTSPGHALGQCQHSFCQGHDWRKYVPLNMTPSEFCCVERADVCMPDCCTDCCTTAVPRSKSGPPAKTKLQKGMLLFVC